MTDFCLAGDIGGTKTLLQVGGAHPSVPLLRKSYASAAYAGLDAMLAEFLREAGVAKIAAACFAVAGPVTGRRVQLTNLPWQVDADTVAAQFGIGKVQLINDFEAVGLGIAALAPADLYTLQAGAPQPHSVRAVTGAGTGLGVGWLTWNGSSYEVHASEGGHLDFAPADKLQDELLAFLRQRYGHVSYERIVSGPGLVALFEFLRASGRGIPSADLLAALDAGDGAATIVRFAVERQEPTAVAALNLFVAIYGAFAGNLALAMLPRDGLFIAGGIAPKIISRLAHSDFMRAFLDKGRFAGLLAGVPVQVVMNPQVGLLGAAMAAKRLQ
ncbi:MAG: glucokinase [Pseudomonadota bacterium]